MLTTYYFIRHTEKDISNLKDRDSDLTAEGVARAEKWAEIFKEVGFDMIFSTNFKRTFQTASIIANKQLVDVNIYDARKASDAGFQQLTRGKIILVVGHSNTNPRFVNAILGKNKYGDIDEADYGSLFIVNVNSSAEKNCQVLNIN